MKSLVIGVSREGLPRRPGGVGSLALWEKLRTSLAQRSESVTAARVSDLRLAASFVRSIESGNPEVNLEIQRIARRISYVADKLNEPAETSNEPCHT
jgi:hypothetical protein